VQAKIGFLIILFFQAVIKLILIWHTRCSTTEQDNSVFSNVWRRQKLIDHWSALRPEKRRSGIDPAEEELWDSGQE
jgi:hypothetical protein